MGAVLFFVMLLATIGQVVVPLRSKSRSAAAYGWLTMWLVGVAAAWVGEDSFPEWQKPAWAESTTWVIISWVFLLVGAWISWRKPQKKPRTH